MGFDEAMVMENRHTSQDKFRRYHPSVEPDNQNTRHDTKPLISLGGP